MRMFDAFRRKSATRSIGMKSSRRNGSHPRAQDGAQRYFIAEYDDPDALSAAVRAAKKGGYTIADVQTPFPIHGIEKVIGLRPTRLPLVCLLFAISGALAKLWFQIWTSASSWPVNVGGKPLTSVPAFIPVTFEITVLFAGLGTVAALLFRSRLFPGRQTSILDERATGG